jgi:hypothetical protein
MHVLWNWGDLTSSNVGTIHHGAQISHNHENDCNETSRNDCFSSCQLDIVDMLDFKEPTNYGPEDFFPIFAKTFEIDENDLNNVKTIQFQFFSVLTSFLNLIGNENPVNEEAYGGLRSLMSIPVMLYNILYRSSRR